MMALHDRECLPPTRRCISQKVKVNGQTVHYSIGLYPDGRPGELFIEVAKAGAALRNWAGEAGMMLSIALQHGTPLETIVELFIGTRCEPCGKVTGHPCIKKCYSVMDLIARDLAITFLNRNDLADSGDYAPSTLIVMSSHHGRTGLGEGVEGDLSRVREPEGDTVSGGMSDLLQKQGAEQTGPEAENSVERGTSRH